MQHLNSGMVSIIILTHNAPEYVERTLESLQKTPGRGTEYEIIVLDNASENETCELLWSLRKKGYIDKLIFENENTFFSRGNNLAATFCSAESEYILLLNSDIQIKDSFWLQKLLKIHQPGITSLGMSYLTLDQEEPFYLADGYCCLIDRLEYEKHQMDTRYEFWYSLPTLELKVLKSRKRVCAIKEHEKLLHHFGQKSGMAWKTAKGIDAPPAYSKREKRLLRQVKVQYSMDELPGKLLKDANFLWGYHADGWCEPLVVMEVSSTEGKLTIEGYYPRPLTGNEQISVYEGRRCRGRASITNESFRVHFSISKNQVVKLKIKSNFFFRAENPDIRTLSYVLSELIVT